MSDVGVDLTSAKIPNSENTKSDEKVKENEDLTSSKLNSSSIRDDILSGLESSSTTGSESDKEIKNKENIPKNEEKLNDETIKTVEIQQDTPISSRLKETLEETKDEKNDEKQTFNVTEPGVVKVVEKTENSNEKESEENNEMEEKPAESETKLKNDENELISKEEAKNSVSAMLDQMMGVKTTEKDETKNKESDKTTKQAKKTVVVKKPKEIPKIPISSPKKKISFKEQQESSARLSAPKPKPVALLPEPKKKVKTKTKNGEKHDPDSLNSSRRARCVPKKETEQKLLKATPEFIEMMNADSEMKKQKKEQARSMLAMKNMEKNSLLSHEEIVTMTNGILNGRERTIDDPATVADVVNELTNRRIEAMRENDYLKADKLRNVSEKVKLQFRLRDRENFHREFLADFKARLAEAKESQKNIEATWKTRMKDFKVACKEEIETVRAAQNEKIDEFERYWKSDEAARKFSKKSSTTLNQLTIEKNMALTNDLIGAHNIHKRILKAEQAEAKEKSREMMQSMLAQQNNLVNQLNIEMENVIQSQETMKSNLQRQNEQEVQVAARRVEILQRILNEESNINNFCSKKFKKSADKVVPMAVTINGGNDIPTCGKTRSAPRNTSVLMSFRESTISSPLQLPKLKFKRPKTLLDIKEQEERKKKEEEF